MAAGSAAPKGRQAAEAACSGGLERRIRGGVALVGSFGGEVDFAFTERSGGVSKEPYASLNLGLHVGDNPACVAENRRRVLLALDAAGLEPRLLTANQVHEDAVVVVSAAGEEALARAREELAAGADAVVCTVPDVPVMLLYADCTPVVLTAPGAFAVVHSGWRGTYARIAAKAACVLAREAGCDPSAVSAFIGPHILGDEYEVSAELLQKFALQFDNIELTGSRCLDMSAVIRISLEEVGVLPCAIHDAHLSTMRLNDRFFSYRAEGGTCGRHGAVALMRSVS